MRNWMEEGIETVAQAEDKLKSVEKSDRIWHEIIALAGIMHKNPTVKQREMVLKWQQDFSMDMISIAIDQMKENTDSPKLSYVDTILKSWKKKGISTPADVAAENEQFAKSKAAKKSDADDKIGGTPSYNLEEIKKNALNNTDIKF
ncbi:MAG: DnaD domain protein [Eubacterium sp.]|nr:DnaD domain protein [Eubacterium sp.]